MKSVELRGLALGTQPVFVGTSLADSVEGMLEGASRVLASGADCVELRIDKLGSIDAVENLVSRIEAPHIVACRTPQFGGFFEGSEDERIDLLAAAAKAGAAAVDIEFFAEPGARDRLINEARSVGVPVLIGYENMQETPSVADLTCGVRELSKLQPDLAKLAVRALGLKDLVSVLEVALEMQALLHVPYAAIALGPFGAPSRPLALALGASFTYCALEAGGAPGQLTVEEARSVLETVSAERWLCSSS